MQFVSFRPSCIRPVFKLFRATTDLPYGIFMHRLALAVGKTNWQLVELRDEISRSVMDIKMDR